MGHGVWSAAFPAVGRGCKLALDKREAPVAPQRLAQKSHKSHRRLRRLQLRACAQLNESSPESVASGSASRPSQSTAAAAASLDAAASTFVDLRTSLPFITSEQLVADDVRFIFGNGLVSLRGREQYIKCHAHWRRHVPETLGHQWKWEVVRYAQNDPRTLVVRWKASWRVDVPSWTLVGAALEEGDRFLGEGGEADTEPPSGAASLELPSVSVSGLTRRLEDAETALLDAQSALQRDAPGAAEAAAALSASLAKLKESLATSRSLLAEVEHAERDAVMGWITDGEDVSEARLKDNLATLRERLTSSVQGTSTFTLDAEGRLISHVDSLDFGAADEAAQGGASSASAATAAAAAADDFPALTAEERSASAADALFAFCLAHQPLGQNSWSWRWAVTKHILWETFNNDSAVDDEIRMQMPREEFEDLVVGLIVSTSFTGAVCLTVFTYWALVLAPQLPKQLEEAGVSSAFNEALPQAVQQAAAHMASLMHGPSLFS